MRGRNTLIMAIVALLLGAAVYFLEIRGAVEREEAEAVADRLLRFEATDVQRVTITRAEGSIALARGDDDTWRITAPHDLAADAGAVDGVLTRLESADHERLVEETPEDLTRFGLAEPQVSVALELADGTRHELAFGDGTPVGFNVFVKRGDGDAVYTAAAGIKDAVDKSLFDLRDRKVLNFADADVTRVEIVSEALDATLERQPDAGDGIDRWSLRAPLEAPADAETVAGLLRQLRTGNAVGFAADGVTNEQVAEFGLDDPGVTVRLVTGDDAAHTLQIGGESEDPAGRYARRLGSDTVMVVPASVIDALPASLTALRNRTVVAFARDRVEAITLDRPAEPVRLEKDGVDWRITAPRALDGDAGAVSSLLTAALNLRARAFPEGDPDAARFGFADPYLTASFELEPLPGEQPAADAGEVEGTEGAQEPDEQAAEAENPGAERAAVGAAQGLPGETVTLLVGAATEVSSEDSPTPATGDEADAPAPEPGRFVRVAGQPTVFAVAEADLEDLDVDLFTLRSKTLVSFAPSDLTRIEVGTPTTTVTVDKNAEGAWTRDGSAVDEAAGVAIDDLLWRLNYLDMHGVAIEPAGDETVDLSPYGLVAPEVTVRAFVGDQLAGAVSIGAAVPDSDLQDLPTFAPGAQTWVTVEGRPGVFRVDVALRDAAQALLEALS
jgi:hypothetical protein